MHPWANWLRISKIALKNFRPKSSWVRLIKTIFCTFPELGLRLKQKWSQDQQGGSRTTCLACFRDHILLHSLKYIRFENTSKYVDTLTLFSKNLNQRSLTPRWPLTPCLLRSHVWLYPRITVSKSHDNTSMYVDTVINFAKYHIHTHTYIHIHTHTCTYIHTTYRMSDHIVSYWTQFRRDKNRSLADWCWVVFVKDSVLYSQWYSGSK